MILSDRDIKKAITDGRIQVESTQEELFRYIHASSMDFRLGPTFKLYEHSKFPVLDPMNPESFAGNMRTITIPDGEAFIVQPGEFILGVTQEKITLPDDIVARVEGRSSLGRLGIIVHSTAGFVDPGFSGTITLEISNLNRLPIALYPGMRICQVAFEKMSSPADMPYHSKPFSKYQGQVLPEESRLSVDPEFDAPQHTQKKPSLGPLSEEELAPRSDQESFLDSGQASTPSVEASFADAKDLPLGEEVSI